ncbi:unconventional myosin-Va-like [Panonychus citri]|uniref:unconventional myosin-Va-like n=1 Tax=Panonychus citri TaxID=50023 RepID=UPI002307672E|nr:unconventional myosin-Va-like [Panonychus citri]
MTSSVFPDLYTKGSRIWTPDTGQVWKLAFIKENYVPENKILIVTDEDHQEITLTIESVDKLPPLRNPDVLIGANDLTSLSYLHEPAVLYNLRVRFLDQRSIYTWCGIVLVAVNPFAELDIYGEETIKTYHRSLGTSQLDPHVYAVAEDAYSKLERESCNQSIIVSGESGAGKTVSAKFAMRYFASIAGSHSSNIENKVLASNPIMEAIGNAKTTRNDNSSRFGKYIQIMMDPQTRSIIGGNMRTYLLEKSRVSWQNEGERNFHIFYQLCNHFKTGNMDYLRLNEEYSFSYLGNVQTNPSDDISRFYEAMQCLGFTDKQQSTIFQIIAAVLHAGNIQFCLVDDESCTVDLDDPHLISFCELLDLDHATAVKWLTNKVIRMGRSEVIVTPVSKNSAQYGRDALAKFIYEKMFLWIVALINKALGPSEKNSSSNVFIGVLDIYGFEHFEINSFEQFCINYANEALQQQFNQHVFKLEQEEYIREGIDWQFITFTDNQPVIDLIEAKPIGILNLLDEECKMPKGTDETWVSKLYAQLTIGPIFQKPKFGSRNTFIIQHFADKVVYHADGFLEKNRDTVWEEQIDLLKRSSIIGPLFNEDSGIDSAPQKPGQKLKITANQQQQRQQKIAKATVGSQFRESLAALMKTLNATTPHYIRCIKPNDNKGAFEFENLRAIQQLRACGVLETIKISSNGFPSRWTYSDFASRYRVLLFSVNKSKKTSEAEPVPCPRKLVRAGSTTSPEVKALCMEIIKLVYEQQYYSQYRIGHETANHLQQTLYQCGKTKIFFRSGQVALLERIRTERLRECAIILQRNIKGWMCRRRYIKIKSSVLRLQSLARGLLARRHYQHLRCTKAAVIIQSNWRAYISRKRYLKLKQSAFGLQKYGRGLLARRKFLLIKQNLAAIVIQKNIRMFLARRKYQDTRKKIVLAQCQVRRWLARRELKRLKVEARSVEHVKALNKGLEIKIIELQQKIQAITSERTKFNQKDAEIEDLKNEKNKLEMEIKNLQNKLTVTGMEFEKFTVEWELAGKRVNQLEEQIKLKDKEIRELKETQEKEEAKFDAEALEKVLAEKEKVLVAKFERERKILLDERESEKTAHQQLLRKYSALEEKLQSSDEISFYEEKGPDISTVSLMMRLSELEQENAKLKHENQEMREAFANFSSSSETSTAAALLSSQCATLQSELDRVREERTNLKTIVLGQESSIREPIAENEVFSAFKSIIKQLEKEVEIEKRAKEEMKGEMDSLRSNSSLGYKSLKNSLDSCGSSNEGNRTLQEKILLEQKCNQLTEEVKALRLKLLRHKVLGDQDESENNQENSGPQEDIKNSLGMFKYNRQDESLILRMVVINLDPNVALKFPPHLPAFVIFMCVRYTDHINDDLMVRSLLNNYMISIKRTVKKQNSLDHYVLWLANCCKMVTFIRQYSGDETYGVCDESLKNFDLSEYRQMFADFCHWLYSGVIRHAEELIQSLIVPAILEHEALASSGIYSQPANTQRPSVSDQDSLPNSPTEKHTETLIRELSTLHKIVLLHVVEPDLIHQIFKQLFYFICASALNNLLLRKDLCHWTKAMQIRFNLSALEQWAREQQIPNCNEVVEKLEPIIQATKLLQAKKTESSIETIVEVCNKLSSSQIMKILTLYTAGEEGPISPQFIKQVQLHLQKTRGDTQSSTLLMETKFSFTVTIPYNPSIVRFQTITIPNDLIKKGLGTVLIRI